MPRKTTLAAAIAAALALSAAGVAADKGLVWPHRTDKQGEPFSDYGGGWSLIGGRPGDERVFLDFFQHQAVDDVITIDEITAGAAKGSVRVLDLAIAVRRPGEPYLTAATYQLDPATPWRECDGQFITDPAGYEVQPGEVVMLVQRLRLTEPGRGKLAPAEITFRRNGVRFRSHPAMHIEVRVGEQFGKRRQDLWERACRDSDGAF